MSEQQAADTCIEDGMVALILPGSPIVERNGELVCGVLLSPDNARQLAINLIEWAQVAEASNDNDE